jgi:O-methyltransferase
MMVSTEQHTTLERLLAESMDRPGDVVEAGCNAGSTSILLAQWMQNSGRDLHLFDSFDGLPEACGLGGLMVASRDKLERTVCNYLEETVLPDFVHIHAGWFTDTMPEMLPQQINFAFVDCDVFESVMDSVPAIMERLTGVLALHDYTHERWGGGVRRAVETIGMEVEIENGMAIARGEQC